MKGQRLGVPGAGPFLLAGPEAAHATEAVSLERWASLRASPTIRMKLQKFLMCVIVAAVVIAAGFYLWLWIAVWFFGDDH
jgi:hypothetical protein